MSNSQEELDETQARIRNLQPQRDPESNWAVDVSKELEDYMLKICSGEGNGDVNFVEAALLIQNSALVYSRKVEYLYSLVLRTLDFIKDKGQNDQPEGTSAESEENPPRTCHESDNDQFWDLDDIPVDAKNSLHSTRGKDINKFVKAPADLVVLEGDCLDSTGEGSELESYLLATADLYRDFLLLDSRDAVAVDDFLKSEGLGKGQNDDLGGDSAASKSFKGFQSPGNWSGGSARKSPGIKNPDAHSNEVPPVDLGEQFNDIGPDPLVDESFENNFNDFQMLDGYPESDDEDDEDDTWDYSEPHDLGQFNAKTFKIRKSSPRLTANVHERIPRESHFSRVHRRLSTSKLNQTCKKRPRTSASREPLIPLYEKLRDLVLDGANETSTSGDGKDCDAASCDDDNGGFDFDQPDFDLPEDRYDKNEVPMQSEEHAGGEAYFDNHEDPSSQPTLEQLCQSHLDSLLASIAETEVQTELASRVSIWKQRIEENLEEQDSHPPFDIHVYGEKVLEKLSKEADHDSAMSFTNVVAGLEKHDVARTFSALLQLVNNGDVRLVKNSRGGELTCYTGERPFHVRLVTETLSEEATNKRARSPDGEGSGEDEGDLSAGKQKQDTSAPSSSKVSNGGVRKKKKQKKVK